jgi:hypothetical protein
VKPILPGGPPTKGRACGQRCNDEGRKEDQVLKKTQVRYYPEAPQNQAVTSKLGITHVTTDGAMNLIMYGFQRVTRATTIAYRVVAKSRPSTNTRKKVVDT